MSTQYTNNPLDNQQFNNNQFPDYQQYNNNQQLPQQLPQQFPNNTQQFPTNDQPCQNYNQQCPSSNQQFPNNQQLSDNNPQLMNNQQFANINQQFPDNNQQFLNNGQQFPNNNQQLPNNNQPQCQNIPNNNQQFPNNSQQFQTNDQQRQSNNQQINDQNQINNDINNGNSKKGKRHKHGKKHKKEKHDIGTNPRECWTSFDMAEARQYPRATQESDVKQIAQWFQCEKYFIDCSVENGPIQLIIAHKKGHFSVKPYILFKSEEFTGTSIVTIATWGKLRTRGAALATMSVGTSMLGVVPQHLIMKRHAKQFLNAYFAQLDSLLGEGHTVACPFAPEEGKSPIWANPNLANPSLAQLHHMQPVVHVNPKAKKNKRFKKSGLGRQGANIADTAVNAQNFVSNVDTVTTAFDQYEAGLNAATIATGAVNNALDAASIAGDVAGHMLPIVGIGFGYAQYKFAHNKEQSGTAIGRMVGASTAIPLAGFLGSRVGKAIGKKADGKMTSVEETESIIWEKKKEALILIGITPPPLDQSQNQQIAPDPINSNGNIGGDDINKKHFGRTKSKLQGLKNKIQGVPAPVPTPIAPTPAP